MAEYVIPKEKISLNAGDFKNFHKYYDSIVLHNGIRYVDRDAFLDCHYRYKYFNKKLWKDVFATELPKNSSTYRDVVDLDLINSAFYDFNYAYCIINANNMSIISEDELLIIAKKLCEKKIRMPYFFAQELFMYENFNEFVDKNYFKNFNKQFPNLQIIAKYYPLDYLNSFFNMANVLGCFSTEKVLDKYGKQTDVLLCQKACLLLNSLIKTITKEQVIDIFNMVSIPIGINPNQKFTKFLSAQNNSKKFVNFNLLCNIRSNLTDIFEDVLKNFDKIEKMKYVVSTDGKPKEISWEEAIKKYIFLEKNAFEGVDETNQDLAEELALKDFDNDDFYIANKLRKKAQKHNMPHHILNKSLQEPIIANEIQKIKNSKSLSLEEKNLKIQKIENLGYTYEMLDKYDPKNATIGTYASCCATINSYYYGKDIVRGTMQNASLQNMVIRDINGNIIAKGTLYVNKEWQYAVINGFEINVKFKNHESEPGVYIVDDDSQDEIERQKIFNAFSRGLKSFVKQYDKENPEKPILKITVGTGHNRLKKQCKNLQTTPRLPVPSLYKFLDADDYDVEQKVLYANKKKFNSKLCLLDDKLERLKIKESWEDLTKD